MKKIELTKGKYALVDDNDYDFLMKWKWCFNGRCAVRHSRKLEKGKTSIFMHRVILQTPDGLDTDHKNQNALDNRRNNLRVCSRSENMGNRGKQINNTVGFKGIVWHKNRWVARVRGKNKKMHIGRFDNKIEAARAYDKMAIEVFGEFASLNFP